MNDAIKFLIQCYFGDTKDPYLAAIDKAYLDMQTHTIKGDTTDIFEMRLNETEYLYKQIKLLPSTKNSYDDWHEETSRTMKQMDNIIKLEYGQIQKWINMSIKYLYTLKVLGHEKVDDYFEEKSNSFHAPLDSFVLNAIEVSETWSKIPTYDRYKKIKEKISFEAEYRNWPSYAQKAKLKEDGFEKLADKNSYKRYIQETRSNKGEKYCGEIRWRTKVEESNKARESTK